jgi:tRNA dimethylallyltransferase
MEVAARLPAEVIAMDSRQVYRGLDIGTAKPSREERARVPHHGLDLVEPDGRYSAGRFARDARRWIAEIRERGHTPLLVGGTGFFLRALTHPLFREPSLPARSREPLRRYLGALPQGERARWLAALDPASATRLAEAGGAQRQARALEVALLSGRPLSWWHRHRPGEPPVPLVVCVLGVPSAVLGARIEERLRGMIERGLPAEVEALADRHGADAPALRAPGYAQLLPWLEGRIGLEEATREAAAATRRLARRQRTWFRHQLPTDAVRIDGTAPPADAARAILGAWGQAAGASASESPG